MTRTEMKKLWESRISACRSSGQSVSTWCEAHQVNRKTYYYWLRKLSNEEAGTSEWISLDLGEQPTDNLEPTLLIKVGSAVIEIKPGFNRDLLSDVVQTLQALC
jgi:hypothetical protein